MPTIEEYRAKKLLTDKLRAQQAAYQGGDFDPMNVTRGSMGGTYQMPDIYQANLAGPLAKVAGSWLGGKVGEKADASEAEAEQLKQAALDEVMGAGGTMTPQQAIKLQELGIDINPADFMQKPKAPPAGGAAMQGMAQGIPAALAAKINSGAELTPEEYAQVDSAIAGRREADQKQKAALKAAGISGGAGAKPMTMKQLEAAALTKVLNSKTPEEKKAAEAELAKVRGTDTYDMGAGEKKSLSALVKAQGDARGIVQNMTRLEGIIREGSAFKGPRNTISSFSKEVSDRLGEHLPGVAATAGVVHDLTASPELKMFDVLTMDAVLKDMGKLGGNDSNQELARIASRYPKTIQDPKTAAAITRELKNFALIAEKAASMEAEDMRSGAYVNPGDPGRSDYHERAAKELGLTAYLSSNLPELPEQGMSAPAAQAGNPAPAQGGIPEGWDPEDWKYLSPEEQAQARGGQ